MQQKHMNLAALMLLTSIAPCFATNPPPKDPPPTNWHSDTKNTNIAAASSSSNANATGVGLGLGLGIGEGGNATSKATGGNASASGGDAWQGQGQHQSATGGSVGNIGLSNGSSSGGNTLSNGSNSGGNTLSNGSSADNSGGNSSVGVDASDRSTTHISNRSNVFVPGDLPTNAMTIAPGASITVAGDTGCGVLQTKVQTPVYQWNKRGTKKVQVGVDEDLAPVVDTNGRQVDYETVQTGDGGYYLRGSHVTYVLSTQGSANSSQLGLQGGGAGGYGGLSFGSGRSYSQAGARLIIRSCIAARFEPKLAVATVMTTAPAVRRTPAVKRKPVARRAATGCVTKPATVCPVK
jgi:hypothetical protein